ncbi:MAG: putative dehydrogenase [Planctomycetota bacterium]|jgi:predicted dehydrogenase
MSKPLKVALIGQKFMGRVHSNAYSQVAHFFDLPLDPERHRIAGRNAVELKEFARKWGWANQSTRWEDIAEDPEVDLVDVATPNHVHAQQSIAMLEAGKHVACEKPLAGTLDDARAMRDAARKAKRKAKTFVWYNYRRCPAVAFAHKLVKEGRIGRVYHVRANYLQNWGGPDTPLLWRFKKGSAGSGAHGDLNAHIIDMARFITGDEVAEINGAIAPTFIKERRIIGSKKMGKSTVDDAVLFLATFKSGAVGSFEASRLAGPNQNANTIEINGELGSLRFEFQNMNVLKFYDETDGAREGGWREIMCTSAGNHPYAANWWPDAHVLGYEHGFINMLADVVRVIGGEEPEVPLPDFADAYETQRVLEAAMLSAKERCAIKLSQVK